MIFLRKRKLKSSHSTPSEMDIHVKTEIDMIEIMDVGN